MELYESELQKKISTKIKARKFKRRDFAAFLAVELSDCFRE